MRETNMRETKLQEDDNNVSIRCKGNILKNYRGIQTKKKPFALGGGLFKVKVRTGKENKWKINPRRYKIESGLRKSTKIAIDPRRYAASEEKKKKRELRAQQRDASKVDYKLYTYQTLKVTLPEYDDVTSKLKIAKSQGDTKKIAKLEAERKRLKKSIRKLGKLGKHGTVNIEKLSKQVKDGLAKYEAKQKYYTDSGDKLKRDAVEYIQMRSEFIKHGQPELQTKLAALTSFDPLKMAMIRVPGQPPKPVNKIKYSDFKIDDPKITNAYLDQFKVVNDSIRKINKDFNIDILSPERRVELAHELHKITAEGIYDPVEQEKHFLKAVTEIAYKDRYYSVLDSRSKDASSEYLKSGLGAIPMPNEDTSELNLKQQRDLLAQRYTAAPDSEKTEIGNRIKQLDIELSRTPADIHARRILLEGQIKVLPVSNPKYQEVRDEIERLTLLESERRATQQSMNVADTEVITKNIAILEKQISKQNIDANRDRLEKINAKLSDPNIEERNSILLTKSKERLIKRIAEYDDAEKTINTYRELLPEARKKFMSDLALVNSVQLKQIYNAELAKRNQILGSIGANPELQQLYDAKLSGLQNMIHRKELQESLMSDPELTPRKREFLLSQITLTMPTEDVAKLRDNIKSDRSINLMDAAQRTTETRAKAIASKQQAMRDIIRAKQDAWNRGKMSGLKSLFVNSPELKDAKTRKRLFTAEENALRASQQAYTAAMQKKGLQPGQEVIKTKYGTIRLGNEARAVNNLVQKRITNTAYAAAKKQNKQQSKVNISNNEAERISTEIRTREAYNRINALVKPKRINMVKLNQALNTFQLETQIEFLTKYKNSFNLNNKTNKVKYAQITDMLTNKLDTLQQLKKQYHSIQSPVYEEPEPANLSVNPLTGTTTGFQLPSAKTLMRARVALKPVPPTQ